MDFNGLLKDILYIVLVVILPILVTYTVKFLKAKGNEAITSIDNVKVQEKLSLALEIVSDVVTFTTQTYVESLKNKGEFTKEAAAEALNTAKQKATVLISQELQKFITDLYGDFNEWLVVQIEAAVHDQKQLVSVEAAE